MTKNKTIEDLINKFGNARTKSPTGKDLFRAVELARTPKFQAEFVSVYLHHIMKVYKRSELEAMDICSSHIFRALAATGSYVHWHTESYKTIAKILYQTCRGELRIKK